MVPPNESFLELDLSVLDGTESPASTPDVDHVSIGPGMRLLDLFVHASPAVLGGAQAYLTVTLLTGDMLYEGPLEETATLRLRVAVPSTTLQVKAMLEAGTKYRHAIVDVPPDGVADYAFV